MSKKRGLESLNSKALAQKYQSLGNELINSQREHLKTQLQVFQNALISFKSEYASEIIQNEEARTCFAEICMAFGIDPLVVASSVIGEQNNNVERNNQLCIKMIELSAITRPINGGIISIQDLLRLINADTWVNHDLQITFTEKDILSSLDSLRIMGDELQLVTFGKHKYIKSIPQELNVDEKTILETADLLGYVSVSLLRDNFNWKKLRCKNSIDDLVANGILWVDIREKHEAKYWITSWINN
jgi:ESCRT-II complex subunit VPS22